MSKLISIKHSSLRTVELRENRSDSILNKGGEEECASNLQKGSVWL